MDELIEQLKKNTVQWGLLSPEEQECFRKVGKENCRFYDFWSHTYKPAMPHEIWGREIIYQIDSDYQLEPPEPKYYSCPVYSEHGRLYIQWQGQKLSLHKVLSLADFHGFWGDSQVPYGIDEIGDALRSNQKPVAKFVKDISRD